MCQATTAWKLLVVLIYIGLYGLYTGLTAPSALAYYPEPATGTEAAAAMTLDEQLERQMAKLNLGGIDTFLNQLDREVGQYLPRLGFQEILANLRQGKLPLDPAAVGRGLLKYLFHELLASGALLGQLLILAVACAVLQNLQAAFSAGSISTVARGVAFLALITLALTSFTLAVRTGGEAIDRMVSFFQSLLPALITLLAATGGITASTLLQPVLIYAVTITGTLMHNVLFPLLYLTACLTVIGRIADRFQVSKMAGLLKQAAMAALGLMMTVFTGVLSIYGIASSVADGVGLRAIEFATDAFLPVVGGMLSDAVETVAGTTLLLKSAVSLVGVIIIFFLAAFPMLKILSLVVVYKVAAAVVQPFGEDQLADALDGIGGALTMVFACVAVTGLIFFLAIAVIVVLGNITVALRG
ncbi:stage III sporulation protein AE [Moorella sp. E308F]|uniref:stage III sporulation protein AE n=1 Tax=Moorella sp. E308F TaxID=2572682 RepID=UPI0010FFC378|nr:stage III sporulation protein AE [Moorella sp. E308F]GEA15971.1 stage III sporulation protein AE [Moorella sp. E308F]